MNTIRWMVGAGLSSLVVAVGAVGAALPGCGTSEHVATDGGNQAPDANAPTTAGPICSDAATCASHFCLGVSENAQGAAGLCSAACVSNAECGAQGICVPRPAAADGGASAMDGGGACFHTCSGPADCADGLPCIWEAPLEAGVCQPLPKTFCTDIGATNACDKCLGLNCCAQVTACAEDIACAQGETKPAQTSGNAAAQALADCAADGGAEASCAEACK